MRNTDRSLRHKGLLPFALLALLASAASVADAPPRRLQIGTKEAPPFVIRSDDGSLTGISIELWERIATKLGLNYDFVEAPSWQTLIDDVASGKTDLAVAPLTITATRERLVDFSHPYHTVGLAVAVRQGFRQGVVWQALRRIFSWRLVRLILIIAALLAGVAIVVWFAERRRNAEHFGGGWLKGVGSALWWAAVTMTTVGFGDRVPRTFGGRAVAVIWMFAGVVLISGFTAAITSELTVGHLESAISRPEDLASLRVGAVRSAVAEQYLRDRGLHPRLFADIDEALASLAEERTDAVAGDYPVLRYLVLNEFPGKLEVLPLSLQNEQYGIAFPPGDPLREAVNAVILDLTKQPEWQQTLKRYIGPES